MRYTLAALALAAVLGAGLVWASVTDTPWESTTTGTADTETETVSDETRWFYIDEEDAARFVEFYGGRLPPCREVRTRDNAVAAYPNAPPIVRERGGGLVPLGASPDLVRVSIECQP